MTFRIKHIAKQTFTLVCIFLISHNARATRLHGKSIDYAGITVEIFTYADFISHLPKSLGAMQIDENGNFDYSLEINDITYAYLNLGAFRAEIYLEPEVEYEIVLPPFTPRPDSEIFNPFYQPETIELGIANETGCLNEAIRNYEQFFNAEYHTKAVLMVRRRDKALADSLLAMSDSIAKNQNCDNEFFHKYVEFRNARIYATARLRSPKQTINQYFSNKKVEYSIPTYWDVIDLLFHDFIAQYAHSNMTSEFTKTLGNKPLDFNELRIKLAQDSVFSDTTFCETLLLKGIYDGYYSQYFSDGTTDTLLNSAVESSISEQGREIALNIFIKKNRLKTGFPAPEFKLLSTKGKEVSLSDFKGKFIYLSFLHTKNYACMKDLPALASLSKKYKRDIAIISIMTDENSDDLDEYFSKRKYDWTVLSFNLKQSVVFDYCIEAQPSYFLIDPDGTIAVSPAPSPTEGIENVIADNILNYKRKQTNKNQDKGRDIYDIVRDEAKQQQQNGNSKGRKY